MDNMAKHKKSETDESEAPTQVDGPPAVSQLTPAQIEQLKEQAAKAGEYWDRYLRQTADFDNYKKRAARERQDAVTFANEALLARLLPVLDAFEMALASAASGPAAQSLQVGVALIASQLKSVLAEAGLEEIEAGGKPFDPNLHEAVSQQETADAPEGQVVRQIRKGYKFRNRLLRPAGVIVAKKPAA
jgi:molecular chaperone GrpE